MSDIEVKKRKWVPYAAIVFLSVMLVLTFLSNTIMNRNLPEVAARYTESGTITARIRGTGTVIANESYEITTAQSYTVSEVRPRVGDEVSTGDVLITFMNTDSSELEQAEAELHRLEVELEEMLLSNTDSSYAALNREIQRARREFEDAQRRLSAAESERNSIGYDATAFTQAQSRVNTARNTESVKQSDLTIAQTALDTFYSINGHVDDPSTIYDLALQAEHERLIKNRNDAISAHFDAWSEMIRIETDTNFATLEEKRNLWISANDKVQMERNSVSSAQDMLSAANEALTERQRDDNVQTSLFDIRVREKNNEIDDLRERVANLRSEGSISEITSPVNGVVSQINSSPGQSTEPGSPIMVIEVQDRGYTLSIPVTAEQSTRVRVGDYAQVDRGWWGWGGEITAVLSSIRSDPQNPITSRLLSFTVHGEDIESNTQLNITISQRSENYSVIIPNSAIRTDNNGDFVLVVEPRTSPLGNRYFAVRANVSIQASDDVSTAVSGGVSMGDFVITTSTRPVEPGMQIRLVDNP